MEKPQEEVWNDVHMGSDGTVYISADEASHSIDSAELRPKNALILLTWLEEHREELEVFSKGGT